MSTKKKKLTGLRAVVSNKQLLKICDYMADHLQGFLDTTEVIAKIKVEGKECQIHIKITRDQSDFI